MEFHNEGLLPNGLPELMCQIMPYDAYPSCKVIGVPANAKKQVYGDNHTPLGAVNCNDYPVTTVLLFSSLIAFHPHGPGTYSFRLWRGFLDIALHEIGHIATFELWSNITSQQYHNCRHSYFYVEDLANQWRDDALHRIARDNPRLGQPRGALKGYPGVMAYRRRSGDFRVINKERIAEWRALKCDAQLTVGDVTSAILKRDPYDYQVYDKPWLTVLVHKVAESLGIRRYFVNRNGRRYLMFNCGEASKIVEVCIPKFIDRLNGLDITQLYKRYGGQGDEVAEDPDVWRHVTRLAISTGLQKPLFPNELAPETDELATYPYLCNKR